MVLLPAFLVLLVFGMAVYRLIQIPRRLWSGELQFAGARFSRPPMGDRGRLRAAAGLYGCPGRSIAADPALARAAGWTAQPTSRRWAT